MQSSNKKCSKRKSKERFILKSTIFPLYLAPELRNGKISEKSGKESCIIFNLAGCSVASGGFSDLELMMYFHRILEVVNISSFTHAVHR